MYRLLTVIVLILTIGRVYSQHLNGCKNPLVLENEIRKSTLSAETNESIVLQALQRGCYVTWNTLDTILERTNDRIRLSDTLIKSNQIDIDHKLLIISKLTNNWSGRDIDSVYPILAHRMESYEHLVDSVFISICKAYIYRHLILGNGLLHARDTLKARIHYKKSVFMPIDWPIEITGKKREKFGYYDYLMSLKNEIMLGLVESSRGNVRFLGGIYPEEIPWLRQEIKDKYNAYRREMNLEERKKNKN